MGKILQIVGELIDDIRESAERGVSDEEIMRRIAQPGGVGESLIASIKARKDKFADFVDNG